MTTATADYKTLYAQGQQRACELWGKMELSEVIEATRNLSDDTSIPEEILEWTLVYLESVMPESEFVAFCEIL